MKQFKSSSVWKSRLKIAIWILLVIGFEVLMSVIALKLYKDIYVMKGATYEFF